MSTTTKIQGHDGLTTIGEWAIDADHIVTYTQTSHTGHFARHAGTSTSYTCSCGRSKATSLRALKSDLLGHDSWTTLAEVETSRASFQNLLADMGL